MFSHTSGARIEERPERMVESLEEPRSDCVLVLPHL